jgi:ribonuclease P protein component
VVPARHRMRRSVDFATTVRRGRRAARQTLVVHLVIVDRPELPRVGFVVSRAVGGAVIRNTVRRRLRNLMRENLSGLPAGTLIVVRALPSAAKASSDQLRRDLEAALESVVARPRYVPAESAR